MSSICVNPFEYFINYAEWYISNNPGTTFLDVLNESNVFPLSLNICCPTCGTLSNKTYLLSGNFNNSDPGNFFDHFNTFNRLDDSCCFNTYVTQEIYELILTSDNFNPPPNEAAPCCVSSNFKTCLSQLGEFLNSNEFNKYINNLNILQTGVAEWNTINNDTLMCSIYNVLSQKDPEVALGYILDILNNGLVISCKPEGVVITSISNYNIMYPFIP